MACIQPCGGLPVTSKTSSTGRSFISGTILEADTTKLGWRSVGHGSVVPTLLIGMSEPFVGLAHPGVSGVAFSGLPSVASYDSPPDTPPTTRLLIRNCDPIAE